MATVTTEAAVPRVDEAPRVYDRSSLTGDFMVMIAGQTPEDFERDAPESRVCEYIDGTIYMPSPATDRHQEQVGFLNFLLRGFRRGRVGIPVLTGPAVLRLSETWKLEPDVFVRADPRVGPPALLAIEVLSRSTRSHDLGLKRSLYESAGVPEVWIIDDRDRVVFIDRRVGAARERTQVTAGRLDSTAIAGFWIDVAWLWCDPLPDDCQCLEAILAGPPA